LKALSARTGVSSGRRRVEQNPGRKLFESREKTPAPGSKLYLKLDYSYLIAKKKKIVNEKACPEKPICELRDYRRQMRAI
jgi:hypothetical protein